MSAQTIRLIFAIVIIIHGLGHVWGILTVAGIKASKTQRRIRGCWGILRV